MKGIPPRWHSHSAAEAPPMTSPLERKIKITGPVVVTANRVTDGAVVYRNADGGWTPNLHAPGGGAAPVPARRVTDGAVVSRNADGGWTTKLDAAAVATDPTRARAMIAEAAADDLRAVGPYIAPVVHHDERVLLVVLGDLLARLRGDAEAEHPGSG